MEVRIAALSIIIEDNSAVAQLNQILHEYNSFIIGRMGIPHHKRNLSIISIVMDAPSDAINALTGKLGMIPNISAKAAYSQKHFEE